MRVTKAQIRSVMYLSIANAADSLGVPTETLSRAHMRYFRCYWNPAVHYAFDTCCLLWEVAQLDQDRLSTADAAALDYVGSFMQSHLQKLVQDPARQCDDEPERKRCAKRARKLFHRYHWDLMVREIHMTPDLVPQDYDFGFDGLTDSEESVSGMEILSMDSETGSSHSEESESTVILGSSSDDSDSSFDESSDCPEIRITPTVIDLEESDEEASVASHTRCYRLGDRVIDSSSDSEMET